MHALQVNEVFFTSKTLLEYKMSLTTLESAVSVLSCFLCADWNTGYQSLSSKYLICNWSNTALSVTLETNWKLFTGLNYISSYSPYSVQPSSVKVLTSASFH